LWPQNSLRTLLTINAFFAPDSQSVLDIPDFEDLAACRVSTSFFNEDGRILLGFGEGRREKLIKTQKQASPKGFVGFSEASQRPF
jgi:hypothetical protein